MTKEEREAIRERCRAANGTNSPIWWEQIDKLQNDGLALLDALEAAEKRAEEAEKENRQWNDADCNKDDERPCDLEKCSYYHRKWPSSEQFKAEYGFEWPDDAAVYMRLVSTRTPPIESGNWHSSPFGYADALAQKYPHTIREIVCACTPWGKPPDDWRPE